MKVFLTGANGMLGSTITRELLSQGYNVKGLIQPGRENQNLNDLNVELVFGDITDRAFILEQTKDCSVVINTAASTQVYPRRNSNIWKVNVDGALNLAQAVLENNIKRYIHIGTANSFEEGPIQNPGNETGTYTWGKFGMDYMDSKFHVQTQLQQMHKEQNLPVIIINPGYMIGPYDAGPTSGKMIIACVQNKIPGYTNGGKCFVFSKDVAAAAVNAIKLGRTGECYIAGNENLSYKAFFTKVSAIANKPFKLKKMPSSLVLLFGFLSSLVARITGNPPKISLGMARIALVAQFYSNKKITTELKMPTTTMDIAIAESIDWFEENGYL